MIRHPLRRRRADEARRDDEGTVLLLTLGYVVLALVLVLVCADATSLYLAQKRADAVADAAALAGADGFTLSLDAGEAAAELTDEGIRDRLPTSSPRTTASSWWRPLRRTASRHA